MSLNCYRHILHNDAETLILVSQSFLIHDYAAALITLENALPWW